MSEKRCVPHLFLKYLNVVVLRGQPFLPSDLTHLSKFSEQDSIAVVSIHDGHSWCQDKVTLFTALNRETLG